MFEEQGTSLEVFQQRVMQYRDEIDNNLSQMQQYMDGLEPHQIPEFRQDYDEIVDKYQQYLDESNLAIETNSQDETILNMILQNLQLVLDYTVRAIDNINGVPSEGGFDNTPGGTEMVIAAGPKHNGDVIDMQNVSPIRAWWENLNPAAKMLIKAAALGAVVVGGKIAYDKIKGKVKEDAMKELEAEIEDEPEEEDTSPEAILKNFKW